MNRKAIFILLLIICSGDIKSQNDETLLYFSPGLQIGYHFGSNLYFSYQLTTGMAKRDFLPLPGITIGKRYYYRFSKEKK